LQSRSYFAKNEDAASALELKKALVQYDRTLLVADPRRMEPKKVRRARYRTRRGLADLRITLYSSEEREHARADKKATDRAFIALGGYLFDLGRETGLGDVAEKETVVFRNVRGARARARGFVIQITYE